MEWSFHVSAVPVAQPRPRAVMRGNHAGVIGADKDHAIHTFKASVRLAFRQLYQGPPLDDCDLTLKTIFVMPRTKDCDRYGPGRVRYRVKKNDFDNLAKAVADSLNSLAYDDDGLIHAAYQERWYAAANEAAHVEISIVRLESMPLVKRNLKRKTKTLSEMGE